MDGTRSLAPVEESLGVVVHLYGDRIFPPVQREVYAETSVALPAVAGYAHQLVCIENLRDSPEGSHHRHHHFLTRNAVIEHVGDAVGVVVARENHHIGHIRVVEVVGYCVVDLDQSLVPVHGVTRHSLAYCGLQREVHYARQIAVEAVTVRVAALPIDQLRHVAGPDLAHDIEIRVLAAHALAPLAHRIFLVVRIGVHAETVEVGVFYPPHCPLLKVLEHERIVQIHVRHRSVEPAAFHIGLVQVGAIRVVLGREGAVAVGIFRPYVNPVFERQVGHPPVGRTAVIGHYVHYHFDALAVTFCHEIPVVLVAAEAAVDVVVVGAGVAVI